MIFFLAKLENEESSSGYGSAEDCEKGKNEDFLIWNILYFIVSAQEYSSTDMTPVNIESNSNCEENSMQASEEEENSTKVPNEDSQEEDGSKNVLQENSMGVSNQDINSKSDVHHKNCSKSERETYQEETFEEIIIELQESKAEWNSIWFHQPMHNYILINARVEM